VKQGGASGYDPAIGVDGMPLDPRHPIYRYK